jgi:hypothetical protein
MVQSELITVLERLAATLRPVPARRWLITPNSSFAYDKPVDLIRAGEFRRVFGAIHALAEGVFV